MDFTTQRYRMALEAILFYINNEKFPNLEIIDGIIKVALEINDGSDTDDLDR